MLVGENMCNGILSLWEHGYLCNMEMNLGRWHAAQRQWFNTVLYKLTAATHRDKRRIEIRSRWIFQRVAADSTVQRISSSLRWQAASSFVVPVEKSWWWVICMLQGKQGTYLMLLCCCLVDSGSRSGRNTEHTEYFPQSISVDINVELCACKHKTLSFRGKSNWYHYLPSVCISFNYRPCLVGIKRKQSKEECFQTTWSS